MFESIGEYDTSSGAAASHTPQTVVAAMLCAALVGPFS
ncbi:YshB family small membrane protein [Klebsiella pneumoniae]|nr:YshB family small membrane protein [Klebsiella pneumoniae]